MDPDYTSEPFMTRRKPVQELIHSFSSLYIESEGGVTAPEEDNDSSCLPPPPPPDEDEESLISLTTATRVSQLPFRMDKREKESVERVQGVERYIQNYLQQYDRRLTAVEGQMQDLAKQMTTRSFLDTQSLTELDEKLTDFVEKKSSLLKKSLEDQLQEMGKAVMDCMKRRDNHLKFLFCLMPGATSTPTIKAGTHQANGRREGEL